MEATLMFGDEDDTGGKKKLAEFIELPNGCICCSVKCAPPLPRIARPRTRAAMHSSVLLEPRRDDFMAAMEALVEKKDKFDYILVETTGLANRE